jgi:hypothetical protein
MATTSNQGGSVAAGDGVGGMTGREMLEWAAKAAGIDVQPCTCRDERYPLRRIAGDGHCHWNLLHDDGDALRLAVRLRLLVNILHDESWAQSYSEQAGEWITVTEKNGDDPESATRRAIVRAAAEIGRQME